MSKQLEIPFPEYADKTIPIPFEDENKEDEIAEALQQKENSESKKDCEE
jgi:hypothetical protein